MGDANIAQDILEGVADALSDLGDSRTVRIFTEGALDLNDPGAGAPRTPEDLPVEALLYDFDDELIDNTAVLKGDRNAIIDLNSLTTGQIDSIGQGSLVVDGSDNYTVVQAHRIEVAGIISALILHIRGA